MISITKFLNFVLISFATTLCIGCKFPDFQHKRNMQKISNEAIIDYLAKTVGKKKIYIDPFMVYRPTLPPKYTSREHYHLLLDRYSTKPVHIKLPDSLRNRVDYYKSSDIREVMADTVSMIYFSPLLETKQKNVYILQTYSILADIWTENDRTSTSHSILMMLFKYEIIDNKIRSLGYIEEDFGMYVW
jgi:hypothetical protein